MTITALLPFCQIVLKGWGAASAEPTSVRDGKLASKNRGIRIEGHLWNAASSLVRLASSVKVALMPFQGNAIFLHGGGLPLSKNTRFFEIVGNPRLFCPQGDTFHKVTDFVLDRVNCVNRSVTLRSAGAIRRSEVARVLRVLYTCSA